MFICKSATKNNIKNLKNKTKFTKTSHTPWLEKVNLLNKNAILHFFARNITNVM